MDGMSGILVIIGQMKTMKRYVDKILVPFVCEQRNLESTHCALMIFDGFKGQNTPEFLAHHSLLCQPAFGYFASQS